MPEQKNPTTNPAGGGKAVKFLRGLWDATSLLRRKSVRRVLLHPDCFPPPPVTADPNSDLQEPSYHPEREKRTAENGEADFAARGDHNHDLSLLRIDDVSDEPTDPTDYTDPIDSEFGISDSVVGGQPAPIDYWKRVAAWDYIDDVAIQPGPIILWSKFSDDAGVTWSPARVTGRGKPGDTAIPYRAPQGYDFDPAAAVPAQVVHRVTFVNDTPRSQGKVVMADFDGKIPSGFIPTEVLGDISWKAPVRLATAAALPANTRTGNVLEANANGLLTVDGQACAGRFGQRFLIKNEAATENNGIYTLIQEGAGGVKFKFQRATDADEDHEVLQGMTTRVLEGTVNAGRLYTLTTNNTITLNTTGLTFADLTGYQKVTEKDAASGYAGLNSASRTTKGVIAADDLIVTDSAKGLVLKDGQGTPHYWRLTLDATSVPTWTDLGTSPP